MSKLSYFKEVRAISLDQLGRASSKAIFFDHRSILKLSSDFSDDDSRTVEDFLLSGVIKPESTLQDLVDSINRSTPIVVVEDRLNPIRRFVSKASTLFGLSVRVPCKYNWCVIYRDIMNIRIFKEIHTILKEDRELVDIDDLEIYVAVIKRKELTFEYLRRSKKSYMSVVES